MSSEREPTTVSGVWAMMLRGLVEEPRLLLDGDTWKLLGVAFIVTVVGYPLRLAKRLDHAR